MLLRVHIYDDSNTFLPTKGEVLGQIKLSFDHSSRRVVQKKKEAANVELAEHLQVKASHVPTACSILPAINLTGRFHVL